MALDSASVKAGNGSDVLQFMMLVGKLKALRRTGWVQKNIPEPESVADHMYRMAVLTFLLDSKVNTNLDKTHCMKLALVHDMAECIVGDLTPSCGISKEEKHKREKDAILHMCGMLSKDLGDHLFGLWQEYEDQETAESKAVKDLDRFDMILQAFEYEKLFNRPTELQGFFDSTQGTFQDPNVKAWVQELNELRSATNLEANE